METKRKGHLATGAFLAETGFFWFYSWRIGPLSTFCNVHTVPQVMWEPAKRNSCSWKHFTILLSCSLLCLLRDGQELATGRSRDSLAVESWLRQPFGGLPGLGGRGASSLPQVLSPVLLQLSKRVVPFLPESSAPHQGFSSTEPSKIDGLHLLPFLHAFLCICCAHGPCCWWEHVSSSCVTHASLLFERGKEEKEKWAVIRKWSG